MEITRIVRGSAFVLLAGTAAFAQEPERSTPPQIVTSGQGEVRVAPDRATISIGVQSRARTAAAATADNSQKQRSVIDAIRAKGVAAEQISTMGFSVQPETQYDRQGQATPQTNSYLVSNVVAVELRRIDQVGPVIDAALGGGANQIHSLSFGLSNADSARGAALALAVARARLDAEVAAQAAGGALGPLIELTAVYQTPTPRFQARMSLAAAAESVPIEAGEEAVRARVTTRWRFNPR